MPSLPDPGERARRERGDPGTVWFFSALSVASLVAYLAFSRAPRHLVDLTSALFTTLVEVVG